MAPNKQKILITDNAAADDNPESDMGGGGP
jgi:hypothetical protein